MKAFYSTSGNMSNYDLKKAKFNTLLSKYPYSKDSKIGLQMKLSGNFKVVLTSVNTICLRPSDVSSFVSDMIENNLFFNEKQTKSKTERGMTRFLNSQFSNTKLKSF